jgi:hypothetical protein
MSLRLASAANDRPLRPPRTLSLGCQLSRCLKVPTEPIGTRRRAGSITESECAM